MSEIVFTQTNETRQLELRIDGDTTWMSVAEEFVAFLQGCGYQVNGLDVAEYLMEVYGPTEPNLVEDWDFGLDLDLATPDQGVTLDGVMRDWAQASQAEPQVNTITITHL